MMLDFIFGPIGWQSDSGGVKNVFSDCQFRKDDVVLGDVANNLLVPENTVSFANGTIVLLDIGSR
jgi:hypothetical protein